MAPLPDSSPPPSQPRRRWLPWLASVLVHGVVLAWWASLPEPPPRDVAASADLRAVELIELTPTSERPRTSEPQPTSEPPRTSEPEPTADAKPTSDAEPTTDAKPTSEAEPTTDRDRPRSSRDPSPTTDGPATATDATTDATIDDAPSPGGLALMGLRDDSRTDRSRGRLRPSLPPPRAGSGHVVIGSTHVQTSTVRDGQPRSLAEAGFRPRKDGTMVFTDGTTGMRAILDPDGRVRFRDLPVGLARDPEGGMPKVAMQGMSEWIRSAQGQELWQKQKKELLESTFELRLRMAVSFARERVEKRLGSLYRELLDAWNDDDRSEDERRVALFQRWDECEEGLAVTMPGFEDAVSSELDELRADGGRRARETIERFIRRQLPPGSPQAYPEAELSRLNATRRSRARFEPYR